MNNESTLWVIHGTVPVLWSVPFRVRWEDKVAICTPALHLNILQAGAVRDHLNAVGTREAGWWRLSYAALRKTGVEAPPGANPEEYFGWERLKAASRRPFTPESEPAERKAFLDHVHLSGMLHPFASRRAEVAHLWNQFCKAGLDWLLNEEQALDLYFVKLHNWPWRLDWKETVRRHNTRHGFMPRNQQVEQQMSPTLEEIERCEGLRAEFTDGQMFHMIDPWACSRFVEVEHTRAWWRTIKKVEGERWKVLKAEGYAQAFIQSARRQWPQLVRVLHAWMANSLHPSVELLASSVGGGHRFIPCVRGTVMGAKLRRSRAYALALAMRRLRGRKRAKAQGNATAGGLRKLPDLRTLPKDLRPGG